jgi:hypothetical protein
VQILAYANDVVTAGRYESAVKDAFKIYLKWKCKKWV